MFIFLTKRGLNISNKSTKRDLPELLEIKSETLYSKSTLDWNKTPRVEISIISI